MNINEIKLNEKNPRSISKNKLEKLMKSIKDFPKMMSLRPIVVNNDRMILGGNMRYQALIALGYKEIPDNWIKIADQLNADEERRFVIEDNVGFGDWDFDMLANEWDSQELEEWGLDVWQEPKEESLQKSENKAKSGGLSEDDFDESKEKIETKVHSGELWALGKHLLICGSCTERGVWDKLMGNKKVDLTFTSPPYNVRSKFSEASDSANSYMDKSIYDQYEDNLSSQDYCKLLDGALKNSLAFSDDVLFNIGYTSGALQGTCFFLGKNFDTFAGAIAWVKNTAYMPLYPAQYGIMGNLYEPIYKFSKDNRRKFAHPQWERQKSFYNVVECNNAGKNEYADEHSATMPIELADYAVSNFSEKSVCDCFGGTGTTLIAAEQLGRQCYMIELSAHYCDIIIARWEKLTGQKAIMVSK